MFSLLAIPAWAWVTSALILVAAAAIIAVLLTWDKIRAWIKSKGGGGTANKTAAKPKAEKPAEKPKTAKPSTGKPAAKTAVKTAKPVADDAAATTAATTTAEKPKTAKPAPAKPAAKPAPAEKPAPAKPAAKTTAANTAKTSGKVYHITKRKEDGKWQIKAEGAEKAIKLFKTQKEAIEYCKTLAGNQDASIMVHKEDGSFRKV